MQDEQSSSRQPYEPEFVGIRIRELRESLNLSQSAFARKINVTPSALANWEQGRQRPHIEALSKITRALDVSLDYLLLGHHVETSGRSDAGAPAFEARVRASFAAQAMMATMGMGIEWMAPGEVVLTMAANPRFTQQHGFLHGGAAAAGMDTACGFAALSLMPDDAGVLTVEFKVSLLAPGRGERFRFRGRVVKPGRTLVFCEGEAHGLSGNDERLIATVTATMMAVTGREDVRG